MNEDKERMREKLESISRDLRSIDLMILLNDLSFIDKAEIGISLGGILNQVMGINEKMSEVSA